MCRTSLKPPQAGSTSAVLVALSTTLLLRANRELMPEVPAWIANATALGACRDDWLAPALSALISRGLVLEAGSLLSRACGLTEGPGGGSEWAVCLSATSAAQQGAWSVYAPRSLYGPAEA
jgi:hypothetical protein